MEKELQIYGHGRVNKHTRFYFRLIFFVSVFNFQNLSPSPFAASREGKGSDLICILWLGFVFLLCDVSRRSDLFFVPWNRLGPGSGHRFPVRPAEFDRILGADCWFCWFNRPARSGFSNIVWGSRISSYTFMPCMHLSSYHDYVHHIHISMYILFCDLASV